MGRHSAPDSDEEELSDVQVTTPLIPWGRHAGDVDDVVGVGVGVGVDGGVGVGVDGPSDEAPPSDGPPAAESSTATPSASESATPSATVTTTATATRPVAAAEPHPGTRGDLHLLRVSQGLRARCAAAVLVPFLIFTVVLIVIGRTDVYLIWLWIPTVLAGVLVGTFLDLEHRRLRLAAGRPADGRGTGPGRGLSARRLGRR